MDATGVVCSTGFVKSAVSLPLLRRLAQTYGVPVHRERIVLKTNCGVPPLDREDSRCCMIGINANTVVPNGDTIAGLKYISRRFVGDVRACREPEASRLLRAPGDAARPRAQDRQEHSPSPQDRAARVTGIRNVPNAHRPHPHPRRDDRAGTGRARPDPHAHHRPPGLDRPDRRLPADGRGARLRRLPAGAEVPAAVDDVRARPGGVGPAAGDHAAARGLPEHLGARGERSSTGPAGWSRPSSRS